MRVPSKQNKEDGDRRYRNCERKTFLKLQKKKQLPKLLCKKFARMLLCFFSTLCQSFFLHFCLFLSHIRPPSSSLADCLTPFFSFHHFHLLTFFSNIFFPSFTLHSLLILHHWFFFLLQLTIFSFTPLSLSHCHTIFVGWRCFSPTICSLIKRIFCFAFTAFQREEVGIYNIEKIRFKENLEFKLAKFSQFRKSTIVLLIGDRKVKKRGKKVSHSFSQNAFLLRKWSVILLEEKVFFKF